jgi:hypothetical protein
LFSDDGRNVIGYVKRYIIDNDNLINPLVNISKFAIEYIEVVTDTNWKIYKNGELIYNEDHGLNFEPVVWFDNIDKDEDERYGLPFVDRFKNLLVSINQLTTNSQRMMLTLVNT